MVDLYLYQNIKKIRHTDNKVKIRSKGTYLGGHFTIVFQNND